MKNFKQLEVWETGMLIASKAFQFISTFPPEHKFGLAGQIFRAAVSIPSNIAEGSSRDSEKDYHRFLQISLGSSFELETQLLIADAAALSDPVLKKEIDTLLNSEQKMLTAFMKKLNGNAASKR